MKELNKLQNMLEAADWNVYFPEHRKGEDYAAEISRFSPAGEDFSFCIEFDGSVQDAYDKIFEYSYYFDADEHAELFFESAGQNGTPDVRTLIEDADKIKKMIEELVCRLQEFQNGIRMFKIYSKFIFHGTFDIKAKSKKEAIKLLKENCGLCLGGDIHSTLPQNDIDWFFDVHAEKQFK